MPDLTEMLDSTTPRDLRPLDLVQVGRRARRRRRRRVAAVASGAALLLIGVALGVGHRLFSDGRDAVSTADRVEEIEPMLVSVGPDVDLVVFVERHISREELDKLRERLVGDVRVAKVTYYDDEATMRAFQKLFANNPAMILEAEKNPDLVPGSFRVELKDDDANQVKALSSDLADRSGILKIVATRHER